MPLFRYKALDPNGQFVSGELQVADARELDRTLQQMGFKALGTSAPASSAEQRQGFFSLGPRVSQRGITIFLRDLALLLRAGLPLNEALHLLAGEERRGLTQIAATLNAEISSGSSLSEAMQKYPQVFRVDLVAMVKVAEASGSLERVLDAVADDRLRTERLVDKISASLRYPVFLLVAAVSILLFFMMVIVPQFAAIIRDFRGNTTGLAGLVLNVSDLLVTHGAYIFSVAGLIAFAIGVVLLRPNYRLRVLRRIRQLPGLRAIVELRRTVLFCSNLSTLLGNGVTLSDALKVLIAFQGASGGNLEQVADDVRRGARLVESLDRSKYLPPIALKMLRIGEESGELGLVARRTADFYEAKLTGQLDRISGIVGPVAIIIIAGVIGSLIVSILSALLSINELIT